MSMDKYKGKKINIDEIYNGEYAVVFKRFVLSDKFSERCYTSFSDSGVVSVLESDVSMIKEEWESYCDEMLKHIDNNIDEFSYHEVLDRTHILMTMLNSSVYEHVVTHMHPDIKHKVDDVSSKLYEVYQLIAQIEYKK